METIHNLNRWANAHTNFFTVALRTLFGAFIFYKGFFFLKETAYLEHIFTSVSDMGASMILVHYVAISHLCGGFFIVLGLLTRWCSLAQLPLLIGAVLVNYMGVMNTNDLVQASLGLFVCCFFVLYGSGRYSVDYNLKLNA